MKKEWFIVEWNLSASANFFPWKIIETVSGTVPFAISIKSYQGKKLSKSGKIFETYRVHSWINSNVQCQHKWGFEPFVTTSITRKNKAENIPSVNNRTGLNRSKNILLLEFIFIEDNYEEKLIFDVNSSHYANCEMNK